MKTLAAIVSVLLTVEAFGQISNIASIGADPCVDNTSTYTVLLPDNGCNTFTFFWSIDQTKGTITSGQGTQTIVVTWNTAGSDVVQLSINANFGGSCNGYFAFENLPVTINTPGTGTLSASTDLAVISCPQDSPTLQATVGGGAQFTGWFVPGNSNPVSTSLSHIVTTPGIYTAKASHPSCGTTEVLTQEVIISDNTSQTLGKAVGNRTVYRNIKMIGVVRVIGSNAEINQWEIKRGNKDWENYGDPVTNGSIHTLNYSETFYEQTQFRARISPKCSGNPVEYMPGVTINVIGDEGNLNTVTNHVYNDRGRIGKSRQYFNTKGELVQSQTWDTVENKVFAAEPLKDQYNRTVGQTLSAPIGETDFRYKPGFATIDGNAITQPNWEGDTPDHVDNSEPNTLGYYYSSGNTTDGGFMAETKYPYAVSSYYEDGSGEMKTSSTPGDVHFLESGKNVIQKQLPVFDGELRSYAAIQNILTGENVVPSRTIKTLIIDGNGNQGVSYSDDSGHLLASAVGNNASNTSYQVGRDVEPGETLQFHRSTSTGTSSTYTDLLTGQSITGTIPPGIYAYTNTSGIVRNLSTSLTYHSFAYNFYDTKGRLVASMAPNGVQEILDNGMTGMTEPEDLPFTTLYTYDFQGRLTEMTEPDAGTTRYVYRTDGQIRFSQNAEQASDTQNSRFSVTSYDKLGRPIASGEYSVAFSESGVFDFNSYYPSHNSTLVDEDGLFTATSFDDNHDDWVKTHYDLPVQFTLTQDFTGDYANLEQEYIASSVSSIESENVQSYYSYDEEGRVTWFLQYFKHLNKYFLIEYEYDFLGNVTKVGFQPHTFENTVSEAFWHHYTYDDNQRLKTVHTSVYPEGHNNYNPYLHATYYYYEHGLLKRVELADNMQGIDYTYTPQGWLKSINHPVRSLDPGQDGIGASAFEEDIFGMTLEYFEGDYARADKSIGSVNIDDTQVPQQYNGNIRAMVYGEAQNSEYSSNYQQANITNHPNTLEFSSTLSTSLNQNAKQQIKLSDGFNSNGNDVTLRIEPDVFATERSVELNGGEMYTYTYDEKYQLKEADHSAGANNTNSYDVNVSPYDENGNIKGIDRYADDPNNVRDNFDYFYYPGTNRLKSVTGYIANIVYTEIGQVKGITYEDGRIFNVKYDVSGKVVQVLDENESALIEYEYDDRGFRVMKRVGNTENWYVRDPSGQVMAIYNSDATDPNNIVSQLELPIHGATRLGMAVKNPDHYKYIYELTDHLGNVRALVTKLGLMATATHESGDIQVQKQYFDFNQSRHQDVAFNHTPNGSWSARTHPSQPEGPSVTLQVKAGDKVKLEVYAKYSLTGHDPNLLTSGIAGSVAENVNDVVVGVEGGALSNAVSGSLSSLLAGVTTSSNEPKAYMQYILFDNAYQMVGSGHIPVEDGIDENGWKYLELNDDVAQDGYLYAYLVNESNIDVHFDDFTFNVGGTRKIRSTDYYPFGAVAKVWNNPDQTQQETYRHDYQGQYAEKDTTTGWNSFELRMYDPLIGRWLQMDPYRQFANPYIGMGNRPTVFTDPDGGCVNADGFSVPCPEGVPEEGNEFLLILDEVIVNPIIPQVSVSNETAGLTDADMGRFTKSLAHFAADFSLANTFATLGTGENSRGKATTSDYVWSIIDLTPFKYFRYLKFGRGLGIADNLFDGIITFGKNDNQIYHAFRHTDDLGLDRTAVREAVENHFRVVHNQLKDGIPLNQVIEVSGQKIQYSAFRLGDGSVNIGRIHGVE